MSYYFEIWLRGFAKDHLRELSTIDKERIEEQSYYPHVTLVRPFEIRTTEEYLKDKIIAFCKGKDPIPFSLEGKGTFEDKFYYVPVVDCAELLQFNDSLEKVLADIVCFKPKLNAQKILHATVDVGKEIEFCQRIDQYMLRLTAIRDKKIRFSYDFVMQEALNRDESLDETRWHQTVHEFSKKFHLLPTTKGYKRIK